MVIYNRNSEIIFLTDMEMFWSYITTLLAGVIAGLLIFLKLKNPETVINDNQQIGKLKQRGDGTQTIELQKETELSRKELRVARRLQRKRERQENRLRDPP